MVHNTGQRFGRDLQRESQLRSLKELKIHPVFHRFQRNDDYMGKSQISVHPKMIKDALFTFVKHL